MEGALRAHASNCIKGMRRGFYINPRNPASLTLYDVASIALTERSEEERLLLTEMLHESLRADCVGELGALASVPFHLDCGVSEFLRRGTRLAEETGDGALLGRLRAFGREYPDEAGHLRFVRDCGRHSQAVRRYLCGGEVYAALRRARIDEETLEAKFPTHQFDAPRSADQELIGRRMFLLHLRRSRLQCLSVLLSTFGGAAEGAAGAAGGAEGAAGGAALGEILQWGDMVERLTGSTFFALSDNFREQSISLAFGHWMAHFEAVERHAVTGAAAALRAAGVEITSYRPGQITGIARAPARELLALPSLPAFDYCVEGFEIRRSGGGLEACFEDGRIERQFPLR